jgi:hypothetical protein
VEELIATIDAAADPVIRAAAQELIEAVMEFHGAGIARMLDMVEPAMALSMAREEAIRPMLLLYDLHPESTEIRVQRAVDPIRNVEVVSVTGREVRVRLTGNGPNGEAIEKAILDAAPEVQAIHLEGLDRSSFVPLEKLLAV